MRANQIENLEFIAISLGPGSFTKIRTSLAFAKGLSFGLKAPLIGVNGFQKLFELGKFNIRVNAVCPGSIKGDRMKRVIRDKAKFTKVSTKVIERDFVSMSSMKKWILEEDIGKMCSFLISDDSSKVSGQVISVDGHTERND